MASDLQKLQKIFKSLDQENQQALMSFAEFLQQKGQTQSSSTVLEKLEISRPGKESVINALQRLKKTYPMIDTDAILNDAAGLVSQHIMQGRAASEVIDELEEKFARLYQDHQEEQNKET